MAEQARRSAWETGARLAAAQPDPTPRLSHKQQIDLDMLLYGSAYEEITATGRRRIDPSKFIMHVAPTSDSGEGETS